MGCTLEDNMGDDLFFCATLTCCRGGDNPFVQAGVETSDTGTQAVKPDQALLGRVILGGLVLVSRMKMWNLVRFPTTLHSIGDLPSALYICCCWMS